MFQTMRFEWQLALIIQMSSLTFLGCAKGAILSRTHVKNILLDIGL